MVWVAVLTKGCKSSHSDRDLRSIFVKHSMISKWGLCRFPLWLFLSWSGHLRDNCLSEMSRTGNTCVCYFDVFACFRSLFLAIGGSIADFDSWHVEVACFCTFLSGTFLLCASPNGRLPTGCLGPSGRFYTSWWELLLGGCGWKEAGQSTRWEAALLPKGCVWMWSGCQMHFPGICLPAIVHLHPVSIRRRSCASDLSASQFIWLRNGAKEFGEVLFLASQSSSFA